MIFKDFIYSPLGRSKPVRLWIIFETHMKIVLKKSKSFLSNFLKRHDRFIYDKSRLLVINFFLFFFLFVGERNL